MRDQPKTCVFGLQREGRPRLFPLGRGRRSRLADPFAGLAAVARDGHNPNLVLVLLAVPLAADEAVGAAFQPGRNSSPIGGLTGGRSTSFDGSGSGG